jgi:hypothetical protein
MSIYNKEDPQVWEARQIANMAAYERGKRINEGGLKFTKLYIEDLT